MEVRAFILEKYILMDTASSKAQRKPLRIIENHVAWGISQLVILTSIKLSFNNVQPRP